MQIGSQLTLFLVLLSVAACSAEAPTTGQVKLQVSQEPKAQEEAGEAASSSDAVPEPDASSQAQKAASRSSEGTRAEREGFKAFLEQVKRCEKSSFALSTEGDMMGLFVSGEDIFEVLGGTVEECRLRNQVRIRELRMSDEQLEGLLALGQGRPGQPGTKDELLTQMKERAELSRLCVGPSTELADRYALYHLGWQTPPLDDPLCTLEGLDCGEPPRVAAHCELSDCRNGSWYAECSEDTGKASRCMLGHGSTPEGYEALCMGQGVSVRPVTSVSPGPTGTQPK